MVSASLAGHCARASIRSNWSLSSLATKISVQDLTCHNEILPARSWHNLCIKDIKSQRISAEKISNQDLCTRDILCAKSISSSPSSTQSSRQNPRRGPHGLRGPQPIGPNPFPRARHYPKPDPASSRVFFELPPIICLSSSVSSILCQGRYPASWAERFSICFF